MLGCWTRHSAPAHFGPRKHPSHLSLRCPARENRPSPCHRLLWNRRGRQASMCGRWAPSAVPFHAVWVATGEWVNARILTKRLQWGLRREEYGDGLFGCLKEPRTYASPATECRAPPRPSYPRRARPRARLYVNCCCCCAIGRVMEDITGDRAFVAASGERHPAAAGPDPCAGTQTRLLDAARIACSRRLLVAGACCLRPEMRRSRVRPRPLLTAARSYAASTRAKVEKRAGVEPAPAALRWALHCCCHPCARVQEYKAVRSHWDSPAALEMYR